MSLDNKQKTVVNTEMSVQLKLKKNRNNSNRWALI